jgi:hypothetical protein
MPLALMFAEKFMASGRVTWLALLALALGAQLTLGHFQIQMWTAGLVLVTGIWRAAGEGLPWRRVFALGISIGWAGAIAAVQLGLTWELISVARFNRPVQFMLDFSFPPGHWAQLALPHLFMGFRGGVRSPYWGFQSTSADEACLYVGTVPLIFALVGLLVKGDRPLAPWRWLVPIGFVLASLPQWLPEAYRLLLHLPGFGHFRAPGRYVLFTSLGLSLLAGRGFDAALPRRQFLAGLGLAIAMAVGSFGWAAIWTQREDVRHAMGAAASQQFVVEAAATWVVGLSSIALWRWWRAPAVLLLILNGCELAYLYHQGTTPWGWSIRFPDDSKVFQILASQKDLGLVAGRVYDLPIRAGLKTAYPYVGIFPPPPSYLLEGSMLETSYSLVTAKWLERFGVTHGVFEGPDQFRPSVVLYFGEDPVLDEIFSFKTGVNRHRQWRLERYHGAFPEAWAACDVHLASSWEKLYPALTVAADPNEVWFLERDRPLDPPGARARSAKVLSWDGRSGAIEHDGTCDLVLRRVTYPGWTARLGDGTQAPIVPADGGLQSIRLPGSGITTLTTSYHPTRLYGLVAISCGTVLSAFVTIWAATRMGGQAIAPINSP